MQIIWLFSNKDIKDIEIDVFISNKNKTIALYIAQMGYSWTLINEINLVFF